MADLVLLAASGLALEVAEVARATGHRVLGALDDNAALTGTALRGSLPVLGSTADVTAHPGAQLVICAGRGASRAAIADRMAALGVGDDRYATVVAPSVAVPRSCSVAAGSVLLAGCVLTAHVSVGRHVVCMPHVTLTHDDQVGDFATLCAGVTLGGSVTVGARAYIGMSASVRENLTIGEDATLGMGSVLLEDLPTGQTWAGTPARPLATQRP